MFQLRLNAFHIWPAVHGRRWSFPTWNQLLRFINLPLSRECWRHISWCSLHLQMCDLHCSWRPNTTCCISSISTLVTSTSKLEVTDQLRRCTALQDYHSKFPTWWYILFCLNLASVLIIANTFDSIWMLHILSTWEQSNVADHKLAGFSCSDNTWCECMSRTWAEESNIFLSLCDS